MASQVVAFSTYEKMEQFKSEHGGVYLAWGELQTQFK
jgi:copper chaperone NosL